MELSTFSLGFCPCIRIIENSLVEPGEEMGSAATDYSDCITIQHQGKVVAHQKTRWIHFKILRQT